MSSTGFVNTYFVSYWFACFFRYCREELKQRMLSITWTSVRTFSECRCPYFRTPLATKFSVLSSLVTHLSTALPSNLETFDTQDFQTLLIVGVSHLTPQEVRLKVKHPAHYYHFRFALLESLGPTHPPIPLVYRSFFPEVNRPGREF